MSRPTLRTGAAALVALALVVLVAAPASAHESRQVGAYHFHVGWLNEPTYAGQQNAIQVTIEDAKGNPVTSLGDPPTLSVEMIYGTQTSGPLPLEPSFDADSGEGTKGQFDAAVIPTRPGDYTFHFTGTINGQKVDERFTSSDTTFETVKSPTAIEFPVKDPTVGDLGTSIEKLSPRVDAAVATANSAEDKANSATTLAVVGIGVGIVAIVLTIMFGVLSRRGQQSAPTAPSAPTEPPTTG